MSELTIYTIENSPIERKALSEALEEWSTIRRINLHIRNWISGEDYFNAVHTDENFRYPDIYFLDIQLDGMSGIQIAEHLRVNGFHGVMIFVTAFREYVFDGYDVRAFDYLLKPIDKVRLHRCLDEISDTLIGEMYTFREKDQLYNIPLCEILSFTSISHYVDITTNDTVYRQYTSLGEILPKLTKSFIQVHRSHIVNMFHIQKIAKGTLYLTNNTTIKIGRQYSRNFTTAFSSYTERFS